MRLSLLDYCNTQIQQIPQQSFVKPSHQPSHNAVIALNYAKGNCTIISVRIDGQIDAYARNNHRRSQRRLESWGL